MTSTATHIVVDSSAFLRNVPLHEIGQKIYTIQEVVNEIKDKQTKERLQVLPYELIFTSPSLESIKAVTEFSKKTGDFPSLSATDIKVLAVTYQIHKENVGLESIRTEPQKIIRFNKEKEAIDSLPGFYNPVSEWETTEDDVDDDEEDESVGYSTIENQTDNFEDEDVDDDESSWVTPENIKNAIKDLGRLTIEDKPIVVGCITADFAMQNVLLQMGLNVLAIDGRLIKQTRTYILRCYGCSKTTSRMNLKFCPHCGHSTLKRVEVIVNEDGEISIKINFKRPINVRGKRFSLPTPKGGKHSMDPIVCADQRIPQNRLSDKARKKTDALNPDYIAGISPFAMNDIYSRSALLGVNKCGRTIKGNPNRVRGPGKARR